jgi:hypothetical protein
MTTAIEIDGILKNDSFAIMQIKEQITRPNILQSLALFILF